MTFLDRMMFLLNPIAQPTGNTSHIPNIIATLLQYLLYFASVIVVLAIIYGGIMYITAGGDEGKATKARATIVNSVIGLVIIMLSLVIIRIVASIG